MANKSLKAKCAAKRTKRSAGSQQRRVMPFDMRAELSPLMDAAFATVHRGFTIASSRFTADAPSGDNVYQRGVELMHVGNAVMSSINTALNRHNAEVSGSRRKE